MRTDDSRRYRHGNVACVAILVVALIVCNVVAAIAQSGGGIVVFSSEITSGQYSGDADIMECRFFRDGNPVRPADSPRAIAAQTWREVDPVAIAQCPGGYVLAYTVERVDSAGRMDRDILVRRIDSAGANRWGTDDRPFVVVAQSRLVEEHPSILSLPDGSFLVAYEVEYGRDAWSDVDVACLRLSSEGLEVTPPFWAVRSKRRERIASLITNGSGGAYIVINTETYRDSTLMNADIVLQRIDASGLVGWKDLPDPVSVASSKHLERNASAASDGYRGVYVAYELEYVGEGRSGETDILAQRIGEHGRRMWIDDAALPIVSSSPKTMETRPRLTVVSDGIVVAFQYATEADLHAISAIGLQKLDTNGRAVWNEGRKAKLLAAAGALVSDPVAAHDGRGGAIVVFTSYDTLASNSDVLGQHLSPEGEPLWGDVPVPRPIFSSEDNESGVALAVSPAGEATVAAVRKPPVLTQGAFTAIVVERINADGSSVWGETPHVLATTPTLKSAPVLVVCP